MPDLSAAELPERQSPDTSRVDAAKDLVADLKMRLAGYDIVLPSLAVDWTTASDTQRGPLIELGRCRLETARDLFDALGED